MNEEERESTQLAYAASLRVDSHYQWQAHGGESTVSEITRAATGALVAAAGAIVQAINELTDAVQESRSSQSVTNNYAAWPVVYDCQIGEAKVRLEASSLGELEALMDSVGVE